MVFRTETLVVFRVANLPGDLLLRRRGFAFTVAFLGDGDFLDDGEVFFTFVLAPDLVIGRFNKSVE